MVRKLDDWAFPMACVAAALLLLTGCTVPNPVPTVVDTSTMDGRVKLCKDAGVLVASGWLEVDKPSKALVADVRSVTGIVAANASAWAKNGFEATLPAVKDQVKLAFSDPVKRMAANTLAERVLTQLDRTFAKHPEWQRDGVQAATLIAAFLDSVNNVLDTYLAPVATAGPVAVRSTSPPVAMKPAELVIVTQ